MIKIHFQEPTTKEWTDWKAQCQAKQDEHNSAIESGQDSQVDPYVYKGTAYNIKEGVYIDPEGSFGGKCAYCESNIAADQFAGIEHYRPKSAVKNYQNQNIIVEINGSNVSHPGYYWLAYAWQNFLPTCELCNSVTKKRTHGQRIGKGNLFPVKNFRAVVPGEETREEPLILNPLVDDPSDHLSIDRTGLITPVDSSEEGKVCLSVFGLNKREALVTARKEKYDEARTLTKAYLVALEMDGKEVDKQYGKLKAFREGKLPYSMAAIQAIKDTVEEHHENIKKLNTLVN
jgi:hypothetical protein